MSKLSQNEMKSPASKSGLCAMTLHELARQGARNMLQQALSEEIAEHIEQHQGLRDEQGHAVVVRNGMAKERTILLGSGPLKIAAPRVDDRELSAEQRFSSRILPRYARLAPEVSKALPMLYLKGLSSGDFTEALSAMVGPEAAGLSASSITRLVQSFQGEYEAFRKQRYDDLEVVYVWVDGVHLNVRLGEEERLAVLVVMGADVEGKKRLLALEDGYRESTESWLTVLRSLKERGMKAPKAAVGDGALGFWEAVRQVYPKTQGQLCWVHRMCNVLDKLPKRSQGRAKAHLRRMMYAQTKKECEAERDLFVSEYERYPKAVESLVRDWEHLVTLYGLPWQHWKHLRTTNPIESTFATLRHRHRRTKGNGSRGATLGMAYKLLIQAERGFRKLDCAIQLLWVQRGVKYQDGMPACSLELLELRQRQGQPSHPNPKEAPTQTTP